MTLNHLSLSVPDVALTARFFEQYFDFTCDVVKGDYIIAVLKDPAGFTLVLTQAKIAPVYPEDFHFGFFVPTEAEVWTAYERLQAGGVTAVRAPRSIRGQLGFYFMIPGDIMAEVSRQPG